MGRGWVSHYSTSMWRFLRRLSAAQAVVSQYQPSGVLRQTAALASGPFGASELLSRFGTISTSHTFTRLRKSGVSPASGGVGHKVKRGTEISPLGRVPANKRGSHCRHVPGCCEAGVGAREVRDSHT